MKTGNLNHREYIPMSAEPSRCGRIVAALSGAALLGAVLCAAQPAHSTPWDGGLLVAQAVQDMGRQGDGANGPGQGSSRGSDASNPVGATGGGDSREQGRDATRASGGRGDDDLRGHHHGNDTQPGGGDSAPHGTAGQSDSAKGSAANSDKGPGHRGSDTRPGH